MKQIQAFINSQSTSPSYTTQTSKMDFQVSIEDIFDNIKHLWPHEGDEQHKAHMTKLYEV